MTTVRSQDKIDKIKSSYPKIPVSQLDFVIVEDIAQEGAFDEAVKSSVPFEAVIHTASPFHFNATDVKRDLLDPAINGTIGILKATKKNAPMVKRVVRPMPLCTSLFSRIALISEWLNRLSPHHSQLCSITQIHTLLVIPTPRKTGTQ